MKTRLISVVLFMTFIILMITAMFYYRGQKNNSDETKSLHIVELNEIQQLAKSGDTEEISEKTEQLIEKLRLEKEASDDYIILFIMCGISVIFMIVAFGYIYFAILRPFNRMKVFAGKISRGDFDLPLDYERSNYFGEFTWAFDSMRREITKARSCEREAIENNKTVIATLSHDIKTPIASIRAYAEGLEANMDNSPEKRQRYISVIINKCDEVSKLTNDLFLHSLSDLDKLKINPERLELCRLMKNITDELSAEQNDIYFLKPEYVIYVMADKNRLTQITENIVNNARKYAKGNIDITMDKTDDNVNIRFRDYGNGIPDEDMPFIFDKFYRGRNCRNEQGSGLGLYIVKYITEQMNGSVMLHNHKNGLEVVVSLPVITWSS